MKPLFESITSRKNPKIIHACSLSDKKSRDAEGLFAFEGEKLFLEALCEGVEITEIFITEKCAETFLKAVLEAQKKGASVYLVSDEVYDKLTYEKASQGIFAVARKKELPTVADFSDGGFVVLESVRDPSNVGAILRTAVALGNSRILLSSDCADVYSYKTLRASMGAVFKAQLCISDDIKESVSILKKSGKVYAAALTESAKVISEVCFEERDSIVIGNEGHGISEEILSACDGAVIIPMQCGTESLNASVAAAIFIWEKARKSGKLYE